MLYHIVWCVPDYRHGGRSPSLLRGVGLFFGNGIKLIRRFAECPSAVPGRGVFVGLARFRSWSCDTLRLNDSPAKLCRLRGAFDMPSGRRSLL